MNNLRPNIKVRTTPEELEAYRKIKAAKDFYLQNVEKASEAQKAAYKAENRPMCGTLDTPRMFAPKSEAIRRADAAMQRAMDLSRNYLKLVGAKKLARLHRLELAGVL
mgnify:CR=1 FL=1